MTTQKKNMKNQGFTENAKILIEKRLKKWEQMYNIERNKLQADLSSRDFTNGYVLGYRRALWSLQHDMI